MMIKWIKSKFKKRTKYIYVTVGKQMVILERTK